MSDVDWMTAKFHSASPREFCHPNYITSAIYPKSHTKTCCYMLIIWLLCIAWTPAVGSTHLSLSFSYL